ncbi:MAG TPA: hypothetical protein DEO83_04725, partial [Lachnospiraceae bacterium]|nr:hypothetical protein [Lachnospiraceae bacterium]
MITKDVAAMITYSLSYADEIGRKKNGTYPQDAEISLRDQLKNDLLVFLGYIYDEKSSDDFSQLDFINNSLQIIITRENFLRLRNDKSLRPDILDRVPLSLQYFIKDDLSPYTRRAGYGISLSKYLINTFNDVGCYFAAFNGISDYEADRIAEYIGMMNAVLDSAGLLEMTPAQVRASMGIIDKPERRPREYDDFGRSYFGGRGIGSLFGQYSKNTIGSLLWGRSYNQGSDDRPYTSRQADMDAMIMMNNYNMMHAEEGTGFDESMLRKAPSGRVDRSISIEGSDNTSDNTSSN